VAALWDEENRDRLGLLALSSNSFLLEITATTHFGGTDILATEEGVMEVLEKLAELRPTSGSGTATRGSSSRRCRSARSRWGSTTTT
jgi:hypothetical protein